MALSACAFLQAAVANYSSLEITVTHFMTDYGSYDKASAFCVTCKYLSVRNFRTLPLTQRTNGKVNASSKPFAPNGLTPEPTGRQTSALQSPRLDTTFTIHTVRIAT